ncbi:MAG: hypothetical protein WCF06_12720, partial [Nitrososphaeraceae archaeon]
VSLCLCQLKSPSRLGVRINVLYLRMDGRKGKYPQKRIGIVTAFLIVLFSLVIRDAAFYAMQ